MLLKITLKIYQYCPPLKKHIISKFNRAHVPPYFTMGNRYMSALHARPLGRACRADIYLFPIVKKQLKRSKQ